MGKFLRILVVVFLVLSIGAFVLGILLFNKRELLKGRTQKLEQTVRELDAYIEDEPGVVAEKPVYPERDTSPCTVEVLEEPERAEFWTTYNVDLEVQEPAAMLNNSSSERQLELMTYYKRDPITNKKITDLATGRKVTAGEGTMQSVLTDLLDKADAQYQRLNDTRQMLAVLRKEYIDTVKELNQKKDDHRRALKKIKELEEEIIRLKAKIEELEARVAELEEENRMLHDKITEMEATISALEEEREELTRENLELKKEIENLRLSGTESGGPRRTDIAPGVKGTVASCDNEWEFVLIDLTDEFMTELFEEDPERDVEMDLWIGRAGDMNRPVTKARLIRVKKDEKIGVANILTNWRQRPVKVGDVVTY